MAAAVEIRRLLNILRSTAVDMAAINRDVARLRAGIPDGVTAEEWGNLARVAPSGSAVRSGWGRMRGTMSDERSHLDFVLHVGEGKFWLWDSKNKCDSDLPEAESRVVAERIAGRDLSHVKPGGSWTAELDRMEHGRKGPVSTVQRHGDISGKATRRHFGGGFVDQEPLAGHPLAGFLRRAIDLLEEKARHEVTLRCTDCGSGYGKEHEPTCETGSLIREATAELAHIDGGKP